MAGYNHIAGMSNNAVEAYGSGIKPLSKITLADLRQAGWKGTKVDAIRLAKSGFWSRSEWHHASSWFNEVDFFNPAELVEEWDSMTDGDRADELAKARSHVRSEDKRVTGTFNVFGGSRRRPRLVGKQSFTGTLVGGWIHIDEGGRKRADGNHIEWKEVRGTTGRGEQ